MCPFQSLKLEVKCKGFKGSRKRAKCLKAKVAVHISDSIGACLISCFPQFTLRDNSFEGYLEEVKLAFPG